MRAGKNILTIKTIKTINNYYLSSHYTDPMNNSEIITIPQKTSEPAISDVFSTLETIYNSKAKSKAIQFNNFQ